MGRCSIRWLKGTPMDHFSPPVAEVKLSELLSALSHALDITEGQPEGHSLRCCWIGLQIAEELELDERQIWDQQPAVAHVNIIRPLRAHSTHRLEREAGRQTQFLRIDLGRPL